MRRSRGTATPRRRGRRPSTPAQGRRGWRAAPTPIAGSAIAAEPGGRGVEIGGELLAQRLHEDHVEQAVQQRLLAGRLPHELAREDVERGAQAASGPRAHDGQGREPGEQAGAEVALEAVGAAEERGRIAPSRAERHPERASGRRCGRRVALERDEAGRGRVAHVVQRRTPDQDDVAGKHAARAVGPVGPGEGLAAEDPVDGELAGLREPDAPLAARRRVREGRPARAGALQHVGEHVHDMRRSHIFSRRSSMDSRTGRALYGRCSEITTRSGEMALAVQFDEYGDIDVLEVRDVPVPRPGAGRGAGRASRRPGSTPARTRSAPAHSTTAGRRPSPPARAATSPARSRRSAPDVPTWSVGDEVIGWVDTRGQPRRAGRRCPPSTWCGGTRRCRGRWRGALFVAGTTAYAAVRAVGAGPGDTVVVVGRGRWGGLARRAARAARRAPP